MSDPIDVEQLRRDAEALDRGEFPVGTVLGDLRDYGDPR
jgi:hypothetical protein